ncbi:hypothetical protein ACIQK6_23785 [Streptomyces sp. NPDC091682]|uniref:hypothetical protein n=1 Tax=Streptomyces sp. NPDC091682 TaxID=3366005 RepID=UPI00380DB4FF
MSEFVFSDWERENGKAVGLKRADGDFRCYQCVDFSFYQRGVAAQDAGERCTYCAGSVFLTVEDIAAIERPKRHVSLAKSEIQRFPLLDIAHNLGLRCEELAIALDRANRVIAQQAAEIDRLNGVEPKTEEEMEVAFIPVGLDVRV